MNILVLIGYVLALNKLAVTAYKIKVSGFKSFFHEITKFVGREKKLFFEINSFCFILCLELSPLILLSYPLLIEWWGSWIVPDDFETYVIIVRIIAFTIYIGALIAGFFQLPFFLSLMWRSGKGNKNSN